MESGINGMTGNTVVLVTIYQNDDVEKKKIQNNSIRAKKFFDRSYHFRQVFQVQ